VICPWQRDVLRHNTNQSGKKRPCILKAKLKKRTVVMSFGTKSGQNTVCLEFVSGVRKQLVKANVLEKKHGNC